MKIGRSHLTVTFCVDTLHIPLSAALVVMTYFSSNRKQAHFKPLKKCQKAGIKIAQELCGRGMLLYIYF